VLLKDGREFTTEATSWSFGWRIGFGQECAFDRRGVLAAVVAKDQLAAVAPVKILESFSERFARKSKDILARGPVTNS
jgi:hypothetical protein